jgi:hypothetical protein
MEPYEQVYETSPTNERLNWVMSHELLHVVASDQATGRDRFWRYVFFGKVMTTPQQPLSAVYSYLTSPRTYSPRWYHEGMAVFMETWMAGGYGRVLGGYDEMVFRAMVADGADFYGVVGLQSEGTTIDFQVGQLAYLYGTRFISYLANSYGPDKVMQWLNRTPGSKRSFAGQFEKVYDVGLEDEWARWIAFEHEWQRTNLDSIRQYPTTHYRVLSGPLGSVSRSYYDSVARKLYSAVLYPGEVSHLVEVDIDTWQSRKVVEIPTPALYFVSSLAYDESSGVMFYTTDNSHQWRDLNLVDVATGEARPLMKDIRTGDIAFNRADKSVWGVRHHNGLTRIVQIPPPYEDGYEVLTLPYGKDMFDIDVSPDGQFLTASMMDVSGEQRLVRMYIDELLAGLATYETLYEFSSYSPANFVFSPDGRYLFGTTYWSGVSNVTRYDFETREMEWVTNGETGFFRPLPISNDSLIVFRYVSEGFEPVMIANETTEDVSAIRFLGQAVVEKYPQLRNWMLDPPSAVDVDSTTLVPKDYRAWRSIGLSSAYPIAESYKTRVAWGMRFNFMDPMWLNGIDLSVLYSPSESLPSGERGHVKLEYTHYPWSVRFAWNRSDFYDFFGPTKTARKGFMLGAQYEGLLINERPRRLEYQLGLAGFAGLDRLPRYQNVSATYEEFVAAEAGLDFSSYRKTIGGVESEKGIGWGLDFGYSYVNPDRSNVNLDVIKDQDISLDQKNYPRLWGSLDYGVLLPWDHSSIWVRPAVGATYFRDGNRDEPLANFYFGGFGNNWIDWQAVKRYRLHYSFPGVELNSINGNNFAKLMLEWVLPPVRFKRLGIRSLYCNWTHLALFTTGIATNLDDPGRRREVIDVGAQLDFRLVIFSNLSSTFSLGYAAAFEEHQRFSTEFMISLKLL